eukprot:195118-Chlamydomonas_euryale.AAC.8
MAWAASCSMRRVAVTVLAVAAASAACCAFCTSAADAQPAPGACALLRDDPGGGGIGGVSAPPLSSFARVASDEALLAAFQSDGVGGILLLGSIQLGESMRTSRNSISAVRTWGC